jgi:integrase
MNDTQKDEEKEDLRGKPPIRSKTDHRYWLERVNKRVRKGGASKITDPDFSAQIAFSGQRTRINLGTANKFEAASRAAAFYRSLVGVGWDGAFAAHEFSRAGKRCKSVADEDDAGERSTLGALLAAYEKIANPRTSTMSSYRKALRKIYSEIGGIDGAQRFKTATHGNRSWRELVDRLPLTTVTTEALLNWKQGQLGRDNCTMDERRAKAITVNTLLRNARSVFAKKHRTLLSNHVTIPDPLPFDEVRLESAPVQRYRSRIDAKAIIQTADEELREQEPAVYAALNLALRCGLRRREIDTLMWKSVDLERKLIYVEPNEHYDLKSMDSADAVDIGDELVKFLRNFRKHHSSGSFVIPSPPMKRKPRSDLRIHPDTSSKSRKPGGNRSPDNYRCMKVFRKLIDWLLSKGVKSSRPIHELRKEIGSLIADEHGIYAASRFIRHADIRITAAIYLDKKRRIEAPI